MNEENNVDTGGSKPNGTSAWPVIGIILILVVIILGGLYFFKQSNTEEGAMFEETLEDINLQNDSDEIDTIEADLDATDIESLDIDMSTS